MFQGNHDDLKSSAKSCVVTVRARSERLTIEGVGSNRDIMAALIFPKDSLMYYAYLDIRTTEQVHVRLDPLLNVLRIHSDRNGCKAKLAFRKPSDGPLELVIKETGTVSRISLHERSFGGSYQMGYIDESTSHMSKIEQVFEYTTGENFTGIEIHPNCLRETLLNIASSAGSKLNSMSLNITIRNGVPDEGPDVIEFSFNDGLCVHNEIIPFINQRFFAGISHQENIRGSLSNSYPLRPWIAVGSALSGASRCTLSIKPTDGSAIIDSIFHPKQCLEYSIKCCIPRRIN
eukprot:GHVH01000343.1.p1 GENE.GHVH01000343.1~~GHVH01000343.1.p1  ORF type:complete len:289 (+),score=13.99 GHVH01000343.1:344-1210(+)